MKYLKQDPDNGAFIIDIETDSLNPTKIWVVVTKNLHTGEVQTFYDKETFRAFHKDGHVYIGHNSLSFDVPVLNRLWDVGICLDSVVDTLVLSYLYNPAILGGHSLDAWGERLKYPKSDFSDWTQLSEKMILYCQNDVELTYRLYLALTKKMLTLGYSELSCQIEHQIRVILDEQTTTGIWFDRQRATLFRDYLRSRQATLSKQIQALFPPVRTEIKECPLRRLKNGMPFKQYQKDVETYHSVVVYRDDGTVVNNLEVSDDGRRYSCFSLVPFNLGSPKQRVARLLELGFTPTKFTKTKTPEFPQGFPQVDEDALVRFQTELSREGKGRESEAVGALAEWLVIQGRASMMDTWFNNLGEDSRIHGRVLTCGATTRRMIHSQPNSANIPSGAKAKYGKEVRSFWGVEPGKGLVLVGVDAAGLENVGLLHYLPNKYRAKAAETLNQKKPNDIHSMNARKLSELLGKEMDREWGAKTSYFATLYGARGPKIAQILKVSVADGERAQKVLFSSVPGLEDLVHEVQSEWDEASGRLLCIDGGFVVCPSRSAALNYRVQSLGAIVMKLACILLHEKAKEEGLWFQLVGFIHDELQMQTMAETGPRLGSMAVECITEAAERLGFRIHLGGEFKIGTSWDQTH